MRVLSVTLSDTTHNLFTLIPRYVLFYRLQIISVSMCCCRINHEIKELLYKVGYDMSFHIQLTKWALMKLKQFVQSHALVIKVSIHYSTK